MWKNIVELGRPQMTIQRIRIACWIPKVKNTHSRYVILIAFLLQQWLPKLTSMLHYTWWDNLIPGMVAGVLSQANSCTQARLDMFQLAFT